MAFKFNFLLSAALLIVVIAFTFCHVSAVNNDRKLLNSFPSNGDWQSIKDVDDPKVMDIAKFAVNVENSQLLVKLEFLSISDGRFKVDNNGITYELSILASEFEEPIELEVVVFENSKDNLKKLFRSMTFSKI
ncbi:hypothetical protein P3S68_033557 [Capsicum galapagoense]